jgi:hypothetical protein
MQRETIVEAMAQQMLATVLFDGDTFKDWLSPITDDEFAVCTELAQAALTALEALGLAVMPVWQDIASAPRDGTRILLWRKGYCSVGEWDDDMGGAWLAKAGLFTALDGGECEVRLNPTHWMPLPAAPNQAASDNA